MLPRDPQNPAGVASIQPRPGALAERSRRTSEASSRQPDRSAPKAPRIQPVRVLALGFIVLSGIASASVGVLLGGTIQDRLEAGPSAAQTETLDNLNAPQPPTPAQAKDARGPNRADLGGGAADLGADR